MTTVEIAQGQADESTSPTPTGWWQRFDRVLENLGDHLNPILVKETRQALKSRQFAVTFGLVLLTSWVWSLMAIYMRYPGILYSPDGPFLLVGYLDILLFPLVVIIPFSAFRSLASEREDGTFELLSISTLSPRQIISGKLISSILQILVYLSALAPCIGFTYLLRGIDIITIAYVIMLAFLASVLLSAVGLVLACVTQQRHWQSALSVIVILLFIFLFFMGLMLVYTLVYDESGWREFDKFDFWLGTIGFLTAYASYLHLIVAVASAQITFESENRSARIRVALLIQHFLALGWIGYVAIRFPTDIEPFFFMITLLVLHWFVMGSFINGESAALSPRVRRRIPNYLLDRLWRNWLIPGPDRGFIFVMTGLISGVLASLALAWFDTVTTFSVSDAQRIMVYGFGLMGYAVCYLAAGRLLVRTMNLIFRADIFVSVITNILLLMGGVMVPLMFQVLTNRTMDNTFNHWTNPFWFFASSLDKTGFLESPDVVFFAAFLIMLGGVLMLLNILLGAAELVPGRSKSERDEIEAMPPPPEPLDDPLLS
ncbi:ABC transporter permease [Blastopirellula marina]|uniref:ABC-2 type transporter transmembrane domain-containing protein n=1 Tax=Blastopirellula marina TaxID=124 RepID=A0A2S8GDL4_9BACT|nr:ABC transporter permease subunit [Blastopirellula marina]PQO42513.1 hypothetical protein C5Y93_29760 [Blastopirellula marina]